VSLPNQMREWVESQIETGHYSNASDYIRDLIRRDQEHKDKREVLIKALAAGEKSGVSKRTID
ncbi:MAG: type II toxin-antitoxin system ParD family antitoxin, partial [Gammaproteobacteria bacterium]|nr:type II toxin-antitoxin system ParD family antitoxin [Gammaproteobacteria bacterium]